MHVATTGQTPRILDARIVCEMNKVGDAGLYTQSVCHKVLMYVCRNTWVLHTMVYGGIRGCGQGICGEREAVMISATAVQSASPRATLALLRSRPQHLLKPCQARVVARRAHHDVSVVTKIVLD